MTKHEPKIRTKVDEVRLRPTPALPIVQAFTRAAGIRVETRDISPAGRLLANFPDTLEPRSRGNPTTSWSSRRTRERAGSQHHQAAEHERLHSATQRRHQGAPGQGYTIPEYPEEPKTDAEEDQGALRRVLGSAVNPVFREGNSDRCACPSVKEYAQTHPIRCGPGGLETHVATCRAIFRAAGACIVLKRQRSAEFLGGRRRRTALQAETALQAGEVIDGS